MMPPFSSNRLWTLGVCDFRLSAACTHMAKQNNVMCKFCWGAADGQEQENTKQAYDGTYCSHYGCWEACTGKPYEWCRAHTPAPAAGSGAGSASAAAPPPPPPRGVLVPLPQHPPSSTMLQQLIATADAAELRRIIVAAAFRLETLASP